MGARGGTYQVGNALDAFHVAFEGGLIDVRPWGTGVLDLRGGKRDGKVGAVCEVEKNNSQ